MKKIILLLFVLGLVLAGCPSSNPTPEATTYDITGSLQVGVFEPKTTSCQAFKLNDKLAKEGTGKKFNIKKDNTFAFEMAIDKYIELDCTGKYANKLNKGALTKDTISLSSIENILQNTNININLATSFTKEKVKADYIAGKDLEKAYADASKELFEGVGFQSPEKTPVALDLSNPSLNLLTNWFLQSLKLNPTKTQQKVFDAYKDAFMKTGTLKLPSGFMNVGAPPVIHKLGSHASVKGITVDKKIVGIDLGVKVPFTLDGSLIQGFNPLMHHVLLVGKTGTKAIELKKVGNTFTVDNIAPLFDGDKETTFKVCAVSKTTATCNGISNSLAQSFKATGIKAPVLNDLTGHAYISGKDVSTSPMGLGSNNAVEFKMDKSIVKDLTSGFHILISGKTGAVALPLTDDNFNHYAIDDVRTLLNDKGTTTFTVCVVKSTVADCSTAGQVQHFTASAEAVVPKLLVGHSSVNGIDVTSTIPEVSKTNPIPFAIDKQQIAVGPDEHVLLTSDHVKLMALELTDDNHGHYRNADIRKLLSDLGNTQLTLCVVPNNVAGCSSSKQAVSFILETRGPSRGQFNNPISGQLLSVQGKPVPHGVNVTKPYIVDGNKAMPLRIKPAGIAFIETYEHIIVSASERDSHFKKLYVEIAPPGKGVVDFMSPDIRKIFGAGGGISSSGHAIELKLCIVDKTVDSCENLTNGMKLITFYVAMREIEWDPLHIMSVILDAQPPSAPIVRRDILNTNPMPPVALTDTLTFRLGAGMVSNMGSAHHLVIDSDKPNAVGEVLSLDGYHHEYTANLNPLMNPTGQTVFHVCITETSVNTCAGLSVGTHTFTLTAK